MCDVLCPCPQSIIHTHWLYEKGNTPNNDLSSFHTQINPLSMKMAKAITSFSPKRLSIVWFCSFFKSIGLRDLKDNAEITLLRRDSLFVCYGHHVEYWTETDLLHLFDMCHDRSQSVIYVQNLNLDTQIIRDRCRLWQNNCPKEEPAWRQNKCPKEEPASRQKKSLRAGKTNAQKKSLRAGKRRAWVQAKQMPKRRACVQATAYQT